MDNQTLLYNADVEEQLLGAILINPDAMFDIASKHLYPDDFFILRNALVFKAMKALHDKDETTVGIQDYQINLVTVGAVLKSMRVGDQSAFEVVGGDAYLIYLINNTASSLHALTYAGMIKAAALRRRLHDTANVITNMTLSNTAPPEVLLQQALSHLSAVQDEAALVNGILTQNGEDAYLEMLEQIDRRRDLRISGKMLGIPSGFEWFDNHYWGFEPSKLFMYMAYSGTGKSAAMTNWIEAAIAAGNNALVYSCEMSAAGLMQRIFASRNNLSLTQLNKGHTQGEQLSAAILRENEPQGMANWGQRLHVIPPHATHHIEDIIAEARRRARTGNVQILFVDYLQSIHTRDKSINKRRDEELTDFSRQFKNLAMELNIPIVILAQPNADSIKGGRGLDAGDVRDSKSVREALDFAIVGDIISLNKVGNTDTEKQLLEKMQLGYKLIRMRAAKTRDWAETTQYMYFDPARMRFYAADVVRY